MPPYWSSSSRTTTTTTATDKINNLNSSSSSLNMESQDATLELLQANFLDHEQDVDHEECCCSSCSAGDDDCCMIEKKKMRRRRRLWVEGAIIVGAGPAGMATAACLQDMGVESSVVLDKSDCLASLWQSKTYDRLCLHLPKQFCQLPMSPFPPHFPTYPTKNQFLDYLHHYARTFKIHPRFGQGVQSAAYDPALKLWRVITTSTEYIGRWLVVATGENAEARLPKDVPGFHDHHHKDDDDDDEQEEQEDRDCKRRPTVPIYHSSEYRNGKKFQGQRVLVVGAGNSGMEIALDLLQHQAQPSIVVRSPIHILPREMLGRSTFAVSMALLKLLPLWLTDRLLVLYAMLVLGDTAKYGIRRPKAGPLEMKEKMGRTPVLDVGTLEHIKRGDIQVEPAIESFTRDGVRFVNGEERAYDAIILATGYTTNVPKWLEDPEVNFSCDGFPKCGWRGGRGLYVAGLSRKGILGASNDARLIAQDIHKDYHQQRHQQQPIKIENLRVCS